MENSADAESELFGRLLALSVFCEMTQPAKAANEPIFSRVFSQLRVTIYGHFI
jgi:hypothetical protein